MTPDMRLEEPEIRAKVIELLDGMSDVRMNLWLSSGIIAGVVDGDLAERAMREELDTRSHEVQQYWLGDCNCHGQLN